MTLVGKNYAFIQNIHRGVWASDWLERPNAHMRYASHLNNHLSKRNAPQRNNHNRNNPSLILTHNPNTVQHPNLNNYPYPYPHSPYKHPFLLILIHPYKDSSLSVSVLSTLSTPLISLNTFPYPLIPLIPFYPFLSSIKPPILPYKKGRSTRPLSFLTLPPKPPIISNYSAIPQTPKPMKRGRRAEAWAPRNTRGEVKANATTNRTDTGKNLSPPPRT